MKFRFERARSWALRLLILLLLFGGGFGIYRARRVSARETVASAAARKGDFLVLVRCRGALKPRRSVGIYTPIVPNLRISWLVPSGEMVKGGDVIMRFDSSTAQQQLMQKQSQLKQAQATLDQAVAQFKITSQQDQTELADARFSVERAGVQVKKDELQGGRIKGDQARVDLGIAEQKLKVQEAAIALHEASFAARKASLTRQRDQVAEDVRITQNRIAEMELKAPSGGLLTLRTNCATAVTSTAECKPYKVGDNVGSNVLMGQIPDLTSLELEAKLEEADRGRIALNQDVLVRVDAIAELVIPARVTDISKLAELSTDYPYVRSFRAYASILRPDPRLRPDMNGGMDIVVNRIPDAISIPSRALFTRGGKPVVYVSDGAGRYRAVEVEVQARNPDEVAVSGVPAGSSVALVDLAREEQKK